MEEIGMLTIRVAVDTNATQARYVTLFTDYCTYDKAGERVALFLGLNPWAKAAMPDCVWQGPKNVIQY